MYKNEFLAKFIEHFVVLGIDVDSLVLFGSCARGEATLSSDIDIAVVMKNDLTRRERAILRSLGDEINQYIKVDLFFTNRQALDNAEGIFDTNVYIKNEGIQLWPK